MKYLKDEVYTSSSLLLCSLTAQILPPQNERVSCAVLPLCFSLSFLIFPSAFTVDAIRMLMQVSTINRDTGSKGIRHRISKLCVENLLGLGSVILCVATLDSFTVSYYSNLRLYRSPLRPSPGRIVYTLILIDERYGVLELQTLMEISNRIGFPN
jgi:hypothetical protein